MELPLPFRERMKQMLGDEYGEFLESYDRERSQGLRLNLLKTGREEFLAKTSFMLEPIPWAESGFYYQPQDRPGRHPYHEAGVYYIQEPSAMAVVSFLDPQPGEKVLDLCAAPGGKTTQIASRLQGKGFLLSNEIHPARARILSQDVYKRQPHTYVILITILVIMTVLTHIIPAGQYQRVEDPVSGKMIVVPGSFEFVDIKAPGFFDIFLSLQRGYVDAANIMFLIIFAYGFVYMLVKNGTMDAALGTLVRLVGKKVQLMIPITMIVLGALSSTLGIFEEVYGLFPVFVGISVALGYDIVVGGAIVCLGVIIGYASGTFNPYTCLLYTSASLLDMFSSMGQGLIPYGAQLLAAASLTGLTPFDIIPYCFYPILMGVSGLVFIFIKKRHR